MKTKKSQDHYYRVHIEYSDEDGCFVARVPELPGCVSDGSSYEEAAANIRDAMSGYILSLKEEGRPLPTPLSKRKFTGKFPVRIDPDLHKQAMAKAMEEGISLNKLVARALKKVAS